MKITRWLAALAVGMVGLGGCGLGGAQDGATPVTSGAAATREVPADGALVTKVPGKPTATPLADEDIPPSLPIEELVPFDHADSGISGLRPRDWTLFGSKAGFQISSSPEAPDGFLGMLQPAADPQAAANDMFDKLKQNQVKGPDPEIIEERIDADGTGLLLVRTTAHAQGSTRGFRLTTYARTTPTADGLLVAMAILPEDLFASQEDLVREMVDSLKIK